MTREPPHNFEAEQALLGAILLNNVAFQRVADTLRPEHFADPLHGRLFGEIARLIDRGQMVNGVVLRGFVEGDEEIRAAGGLRYLADLTGVGVSVEDAEQFGGTILDLYQRRQLIEAATAAIEGAYSDTTDSANIQIEQLEQSLFGLAAVGADQRNARPFADLTNEVSEMVSAAYRTGRAPTGIATGFVGIDSLLGGLHRSDLIILAGRPAMGKTALATNIATNIAMAYREEQVDGRPQPVAGAVVGFFSLEMGGAQLALRILAEQAGLAISRLRHGQLHAAEVDRFFRVAGDRAHTPIIVDDSPDVSIAGLRARARRMQRRYGVGLIVVDYLQLLNGTSRRDGRVQEISEITRGLKALAKELDVPVLALSQLSRQVEQRTDKRPQLADLRESGSIEQDADVVMFVFREEYYIEKSNKKGSAEHARSMGNAELIVAKQRQGATGTIPMKFDGARTKFGNALEEG